MNEIQDIKEVLESDNFVKRANEDPKRVYCFLLCTDEHDAFRSFIQKAWRSLDVLSGKYCDIFTFEKWKFPTERFKSQLYLPIDGGSAGSAGIMRGDKYIKLEVQCRPETGAPYGKDTNFGAKIFVKLNDFHHSVLNIPTGLHVQDPKMSDLIGAGRIFATLPALLSSRHEGGLLPIELAHGIASLSTYPSAQILKLFSEAK